MFKGGVGCMVARGWCSEGFKGVSVVCMVGEIDVLKGIGCMGVGCTLGDV